MRKSDRPGRARGITRPIGGPGFASVGSALRAVAVLALVCFIAGCGGGHQAAAPKQTGATSQPSLLVSPFAITIENNNFSHLNVPPATQVRVLNRDDVEHTVTSDVPGLFDVHVAPRSETVFVGPDKPGTYPYHSADQPSMHGELVVDQTGR